MWPLHLYFSETITDFCQWPVCSLLSLHFHHYNSVSSHLSTLQSRISCAIILLVVSVACLSCLCVACRYLSRCYDNFCCLWCFPTIPSWRSCDYFWCYLCWQFNIFKKFFTGFQLLHSWNVITRSEPSNYKWSYFFLNVKGLIHFLLNNWCLTILKFKCTYAFSISAARGPGTSFTATSVTVIIYIYLLIYFFFRWR